MLTCRRKCITIHAGLNLLAPQLCDWLIMAGVGLRWPCVSLFWWCAPQASSQTVTHQQWTTRWAGRAAWSLIDPRWPRSSSVWMATWANSRLCLMCCQPSRSCMPGMLCTHPLMVDQKTWDDCNITSLSYFFQCFVLNYTLSPQIKKSRNCM